MAAQNTPGKITREEDDARRAAKLATKPTESAFDKADEQAARAAKRAADRAKEAARKAAEAKLAQDSNKGPATRHRDFRGVEGQIDDASEAASNTNRERDSRDAE